MTIMNSMALVSAPIVSLCKMCLNLLLFHCQQSQLPWIDGRENSEDSLTLRRGLWAMITQWEVTLFGGTTHGALESMLFGNIWPSIPTAKKPLRGLICLSCPINTLANSGYLELLDSETFLVAVVYVLSRLSWKTYDSNCLTVSSPPPSLFFRIRSARL